MSNAQVEIADYTRPTHATSRRLSFLIFNSANPEVLRTLVRLARQRVAHCKAKGRKPKVGMRALWEHMRWDLEDELHLQGRPMPRLNNNLAPEFSRWISQNYHDLSDVFELREAGE